MKIYLAASTSFWDKLPEIKTKLEKAGHEVKLPSTFDNPNLEEEVWEKGEEAHAKLVRELFADSEAIISWCDGIYLLNFDKRGIKGYVGGAALIELYMAHRSFKKIFLENDIFPGPMYDEIMGFGPVFVHGNLKTLK